MKNKSMLPTKSLSWLLVGAAAVVFAQTALAHKEPKATAKQLLCVLQAKPNVETVGALGIRVGRRTVLADVARYQAHIVFVIKKDATGACKVQDALAGTPIYTEPMTNAWNQWLVHAQMHTPRMKNRTFVNSVQRTEKQGGCVMTTEVYQGRDPKEAAREMAQAVQRCETRRIDGLTKDNQHLLDELRADS